MSTEHNVLTDPELHEPKGVAVASANAVYLADGTGSGSWLHQNPHAGCYHENVSGTTNTQALSDTYEPIGLVTTLK